MNILVHICCAPCFLYLEEELRKGGHRVVGFWYNPNIHPLLEYRCRLETLKKYCLENRIELLINDSYELEDFLRGALNEPDLRCRFCYRLRLEAAAREAAAGKFDAFTSTLLISKYQRHELIKTIAQEASRKYKVDFYYDDFRRGYYQGQNKARELGIYRQKYCGCIFSERDRYI